jgi:hypothetical protein
VEAEGAGRGDAWGGRLAAEATKPGSLCIAICKGTTRRRPGCRETRRCREVMKVSDEKMG